MDLCCTRPGCQKLNAFPDLDNPEFLKSVPQKYCTACGMPLILAGRYFPVRLLGQGGFGAAFLARDRHTPGMRRCVVKQFQPSVKLTSAQWAIAREMFEREAEVLENLGNAHPLIPDLFAFFELAVPGAQPGQSDQFFYLVQEFIDGQDLEELLQQKGIFSDSDVLEMLTAILPVLSFVHENGTIHRDIKPSNIMQHRDGRYYLLDFGAVRQATKGGKRSTGIYSEGFAPPEQVAGGEVYASTDLYALAVTCVMLLTGKQPADLYDSYNNAWRWRSHAPQVTEPLASTLDRLLVSQPSGRYQSAKDVLTALQTPPSKFRKRKVPTSAAAPTATVSIPVTPPTAPPLGVGQSAPAMSSSPGTALQPATPAPIQPVAPQPLSQQQAQTAAAATVAKPSFSLLELLANAAFWGFESCLLAIALFSLPLPGIVRASLWLLIAASLVWLQRRRIIERIDLVILGGITLVLMLVFSPLRQILIASSNPLLALVALAVLAGISAIAITALFQLIYRLLSRSP
ncbi:MAG TPA: protein kinase [Leptolyngbyaceae cyanobacterium M33_DOE_097]|uniref:non-specific serine/threonine protein kinase n=1 Tax=Oscillatoriales cyanobacterium SpSt-418 TaxID=2282169 RepID=A0A7C3PI44_9CYAN|nr:protein kinase [Leptolyngbyaceae cyanobacterium M33_DOE_097]